MGYTDKSIKKLDGIEGIRTRPGMYVFNDGEDGLYQICKEVVDNSIDECQIKNDGKLNITIDTKTNTITIVDNGRGVPQKSIDLVFTTIHAGGKFDEDSYKISAGQYGTGVVATNALSEKLIVQSKRDGKIIKSKFSKGRVKESQVEAKVDKVKFDTGTYVSFVPDFSIFTVDSIPVKRFKDWVKTLPLLVPGLKITFTVDGKKEVFKATKTLKDQAGKKDFYIRSSLDKTIVEVLIKFGESEKFDAYVNTIPVTSGVHEVATFYVLQQVFNSVLKKVNGSKKRKTLADKISLSSIKKYTDCFMIISTPSPVLEGQTKNKLSGDDLKGKIVEIIRHSFEKYAKRNGKYIETIVQKIAKIDKLEKKFKQDLDKERGFTSELRNSRLPFKLAVSTTKNRDERQLFIVEGDSGAGTVKTARDKRTQEVLPIRGKIKNSVGLDIATDESTKNILISMGDVDPDSPKRRVAEVIIFTDGDADGSHIRGLLLGMFAKHAPKWIEQGRISFIKTPLFQAYSKRKNVKFFADKKSELKAMMPNENAKILRMKGLGECSVPDIRTFGTDRNTMKKFTVKFDDYTDDFKRISTMMTDENMHGKKIKLGIKAERGDND